MAAAKPGAPFRHQRGGSAPTPGARGPLTFGGVVGLPHSANREARGSKYNDGSRNKGVRGARRLPGQRQRQEAGRSGRSGRPVLAPRPGRRSLLPSSPPSPPPPRSSPRPRPGEPPARPRAPAQVPPRPQRGASPGPAPAGWAAQRGLGAGRTPSPEQRNVGRGRGRAQAAVRLRPKRRPGRSRVPTLGPHAPPPPPGPLPPSPQGPQAGGARPWRSRSEGGAARSAAGPGLPAQAPK